MIATADNDELIGAFKQVKAARLNVLYQRVTPHLAFNIAHRTAHDPTGSGGLGCKNLVKPAWVACRVAEGLKLNNLHALMEHDSG